MRSRLLTLAALAVAATLHVPTAAHAAPGVGVANPSGDAVADPTYATQLSLSGSGFQSIKGGHGGVYVFFGTVSGTWRPSQGGTVGRNYKYVPDSESRDNQGFQRFVAFPGSDTASAANGGTISAGGSWSTTITVPGASFKTVDRSGKAVTVDCQKVQCGIITIGAHGVVNARNESFTPVSFKDLQGSGTASGEASATPETAGGEAPENEAGKKDEKAAKKGAEAELVAEVDRTTAVRGRVLSFTGSGFEPGEQVSATLDDGLAAVGPLTTGQSGEIAAVMQLPADLEVGTHELRLTAAASGSQATVTFAVRDEAESAAADAGPTLLPFAFLAMGVVAVLGSILFAFLHHRRTRKVVTDAA
ncbi:hypothetical protein ACHAAC_12350 [Aeromicrobium sp. CF4.19]|uniref:hypothetical protein n=1 Tax=Aeromicrobium sp. CF4.19 TaxID=3373082 RepID=UPI003EE46073